MTEDFETLIGKTITEARRDCLGWWWTLENQVVNPPFGHYVFYRAGHYPNRVECWTENNIITNIKTALVL